jgi:hypothetical protein
MGIIPPDRSAWSTDPVPPFSVPSLLSKAFWGGVWGLALTPVLTHLSGAAYWAGWTFVGAMALTLVAFFVVPQIKAEAMPAPMLPRFVVGLLVNGAWGFGTALFLRVLGAVRG